MAPAGTQGRGGRRTMGNTVSRPPRPHRNPSPETRFPGRQWEREGGGSRSPPAVPPSRAGTSGKCSPAVPRRRPLPGDSGRAEPAFPSGPRATSPQGLLGQGAGGRLAAATALGEVCGGGFSVQAPSPVPPEPGAAAAPAGERGREE